VGRESVSEPVQAGVDVLAAAFDEAVGVEHEGVAGVVGQGGLGAWDMLGAGSQRRVGGLVEQDEGAVGADEDRWGGGRRCCR
jgi:hypothetical protein